METQTVRRFVIEHLRTQSKWRLDKSEEYPEDDRNLRAAKTLENYAYDLTNDVGDFSDLIEAIADVIPAHAADEVAVCFTNGSTDVTSWLGYWNHGEPSLPEILKRIHEATEESWQADYRSATSVVQAFLAKPRDEFDDEPLRWTAWAAIEDEFPDDPAEAAELAEAYALLWRRPGAFDAGEPQPSRSLVELVESVLDEPIWESETGEA